MIYAAEARRQILDLVDHYERKLRTGAIHVLSASLVNAERRIEANPEAGLAAPRPYPGLASPGEAWIKSGRYRITYSLTRPAVILGVFYDASDIPGRS